MHILYFETMDDSILLVYQDLFNDKYDKSDMGYFTNNNFLENGLWMGYNWNKPKNWYNQMRLNAEFLAQQTGNTHCKSKIR